MASIKCGKCSGTHGSVAEVRGCYTQSAATATATATAVAEKKLPGLPAWATKHIEKGTQRYQGPTVVATSFDSPTGRLTRSMPVMQSFPARTPATAPATPVEIPAGIYAIVADDEIKCYEIRYGKPGTRWDGFLFLERVSSDDRWPVKKRQVKEDILAAISLDIEAAGILAGHTLRQCRRCRRTLSDTNNPYFNVSLGPDCGSK